MADIRTLQVILITFISAGAALRVIQCLIYITMEAPEESGRYKKRIRHCLSFLAVAHCISALLTIVQNYVS